MTGVGRPGAAVVSGPKTADVGVFQGNVYTESTETDPVMNRKKLIAIVAIVAIVVIALRSRGPNDVEEYEPIDRID